MIAISKNYPKMATFLSPLLLLVILFTASAAPAGDDAEYVALVEAAATSIPDADLSDDILLQQQIVQDHTIYRHLRAEKHGAVVFVRKENDQGKAAIVLRTGEDFLPQCNNKKTTFVVLKRSPKSQSKYHIFYAYVRPAPTGSNPSLMVEWDTWAPRGNSNNKASNFGFISCATSNLVPCKEDAEVEMDDTPDYEDFSPPSLLPGHAHHKDNPEVMPRLPYVHPPPRVIPDSGPDYWCDLGPGTDLDKRFVGAVVNSLTHAMSILSGAELVYNNEDKVVKEVHEEIKNAASAAPPGTGAGTIAAANPELAAIKLVNHGRVGVAGGTIIFYSGVGKVGALALGEAPPTERQGLNDTVLEILSLGYKPIGLNILRGLFRGADVSSANKELTGANPNPHDLLDEFTTESLIAGRPVGESVSIAHKEGRGLWQWFSGAGANVAPQTSIVYGSNVVYSGAQKDGCWSGSKAIDNLVYTLENTQTGAAGTSTKTAGQIFAENMHAGAYVPNGLIEDAGDIITDRIFHVGKISNDRSYIDDVLDKTWESGIVGTAGQIVDVGSAVLGPIGLGGVWNGLAGVTGLAAGAVAGTLWAPIGAVNNAIKVGAKIIGVQGLIGMHGEDARVMQNGNQVYNRDWGNDLSGKGPVGAGQMGGCGGGGNNNVGPPPPPPTGTTDPAPPPPDPPTEPAPPPAEAAPARRKREALDDNRHLEVVATTDLDLFSHIGWRTVDVRQEELGKANLSVDDTSFVGIGNCILKPTPLTDFDKVNGGKQAARLYFQIMRTDCLKSQFESFYDLFVQRVVKYNPSDKTFVIPDGHAYLTKPKLSPDELSGLSKALEMSVFSKLYQTFAKAPPPAPQPGHGSRPASTVKSLALLFLDEAYAKAPLHYAKLARNAAALVKTAFTKSLQDFFRYKYCPKCPPIDVKTALDDATFFAGLLDFIVKDQESPAHSGGGLTKEAAFDKYWGDATRRETTSKNLLIYFI